MRDIKTEFLSSSFDYLVKNGLENMSIRNLCKNTGMSIGSVYYWFEGKEDLIASATEYGLDCVIDELLTQAVGKSSDVDEYFRRFMMKIKNYSERIRFICQVAASPVYGEKLRQKVSEQRHMYDKYAVILAERLQCRYEDMRAVVYLMSSMILDYSVWSSEESTKIQIEYLKSAVKKMIAEGK